jgi:hypothetical protein
VYAGGQSFISKQGIPQVRHSGDHRSYFIWNSQHLGLDLDYVYFYLFDEPSPTFRCDQFEQAL